LPLVSIIVMTLIAIFTGADVRRVGNISTINNQLPSLHLPHIDLSLQISSIILPDLIPLAIVRPLESVLFF
jgi:sulfate permease, SulP family